MLSATDNEMMCRVGPDTAMGKVMRHYWMPFMLSSELPEAGGDPVHIELLNENLVAFRDETGQIGLLEEMCPHRGASLAVGRVETCGIRCLYHGWLFAADGTVLETPNVVDDRFKTRVKATSYPVREAGGLAWTYLGDPEAIPAFPDFPALSAPKEMVVSALGIFGCNYVQALEGLYDSSHLSILHQSQLRSNDELDIPFAKNTNHMQFDSRPRIDAEETSFGFHYGAIRDVADNTEINVSAFIVPFYVLNPNDIVIFTVPMTDEKTAFFTMAYDGVRKYGEEPLRSQQLKATGFDKESLEAFGMTRKTHLTNARPMRENGYRQDREMMRNGHFTGMPSLTPEDLLMCVSGGGLRDRRKEHLSASDMAIVKLYQVLLKSAKNVAAGGKPIGFGRSFEKVRGRRVTMPHDDWRSLVPDHFDEVLSAAE